MHRGKVALWTYIPWHSTAVADPSLLHFGSLQVELYQDRQRAAQFKLGIVEIKCELEPPMLQALQSWIEEDMVAAVTGWWGRGNEVQVGWLAAWCKSTWKTPLYNDFVFNVRHPAGYTTCTYFLLFGKCLSVTWQQPSVVPDDFHIGDDIRQAFVSVEDMPSWHLGEARVGVQDLGKVKMKQIPWGKLPQHSFQTSLWLGDSVPSVSSQQRQVRGKGKWKFR